MQMPGHELYNTEESVDGSLNNEVGESYWRLMCVIKLRVSSRF